MPSCVRSYAKSPSGLTDDKTDRSTLGELFIELGQHVKTGGSLTDLLKDLGQPG